MNRLLLIELNEINFDFIRTYNAKGRLPHFKQLIEECGLSRTVSEKNYDELEPWIQWVTAHTGLSLAEHGVFRLGDIVHSDIPQIWEQLEARGLKVGAVSPMNAANRAANPAFFIPDPWTRTPATGGLLLRKLCEAISQAVNDNAQARMTPASAFWLSLGVVAKARPRNYLRYLKLAANSIGKPWRKAIFLDQLLADVFIGETAAHKPDFASLFLNAGAHIQHHYLFSSKAYEGAQRNPDWYIGRDEDPLFEVYETYDRIIAQIRKAMPQYRLMLATALHQVPHESATFYWRLKDHGSFLSALGVPFKSVEPRMSRDFLMGCTDANEAKTAESLLSAVRASDGQPLFEVDNRGDDLFVTLAYPSDIADDLAWVAGNRATGLLKPHVAFVAVKNGEHDGIGYFVDTGGAAEQSFPLSDLPRRIERVLTPA